MKIGIIGSGMIGHTVAKLFVEAGHEVVLSNSRGPESLRDVILELGANAQADTVDNAAAFGEVILLAVPWRSPEALPHADLVANKIVIDAMNPYSADFKIINLGETTSSEETARRLPDAQVVKAFNTLSYKDLASKGDTTKAESARVAIFLAGDDIKAKAVVADLIRQIGFVPVDTGSLHEGGKKQGPGTAVYGKPLTANEAEQVLVAN